MRYITAKSSAYMIYIEQDILQAVVKNPSIYRIPGASGDIAGLSYYEGEPVVYYKTMEPDSHETPQYRCGLIIKIHGEFMGIPAETVGEDECVPEKGEVFIQGIWVMKSD